MRPWTEAATSPAYFGLGRRPHPETPVFSSDTPVSRQPRAALAAGTASLCPGLRWAAPSGQGQTDGDRNVRANSLNQLIMQLCSYHIQANPFTPTFVAPRQERLFSSSAICRVVESIGFCLSRRPWPVGRVLPSIFPLEDTLEERVLKQARHSRIDLPASASAHWIGRRT